MRNVKDLTAGAVNRELDRLEKQSSELTSAMLAAGHGAERFSATRERAAGDPLRAAYVENARRIADLRAEIKRRTGNDFHRMPIKR